MPDGTTARQYPDGTLRGAHGHIIKMSPERAAELHKLRAEQGTVAARRAIKKYTKSETVQEGLEKIVGRRIEVALTDKGRAGNDAARFVAIMAGAYVVNQAVDKGKTTNIQNNIAGVSLPVEFIEYVKRLAGDEIINATYRDEQNHDEG